MSTEVAAEIAGAAGPVVDVAVRAVAGGGAAAD